MPFVYLLRCRDGSLYGGATVDLKKRLAAHRAGRGAAYTRARRPVELAFSRRVKDWSTALKIEYRLKQLKKAEKEALVAAPRGALWRRVRSV